MWSVRKIEEAEQRPLVEVLDKASWHAVVEASVNDAIAKSQETGSELEPLTVLFIDINNFKEINDTVTHEYGDVVIKEVEELIATNLRSDDPRFGHIGGDEFGVLAKTDDRGALALSDRLREAMEEYIDKPSSVRLKQLGIGVAIGVAVLQPGMKAHDLLRLADEDMYEDKENQLAPLTPEQRAFLEDYFKGLKAFEIRISDIGKYARKLARESGDS